jgi:hypothetical protein
MFVIGIFVSKTGKFFPNQYGAATRATLREVFASAALLACVTSLS